MNPLSALFGAGIEVRNRLYDRGRFRAKRLRGPVVSIGSISAGGAGKTPFLLMLGALLKQRGLAFDVLSRGYGRRTKGVALVDPDGSPQDFGDEPLLIARKLDVPVIVGEDRYAAGQFAEEKFGLQLQLHLLDDGFQHRRLERDFDIVLITQRDLQDSLLPVGRLREPLSSLARASAIVLMDRTALDQIPVGQDQCLWRVSRRMVPPAAREPCFAFCGIARPENFFSELRAAGIHLAGMRTFRDHHAYHAGDIQMLLRLRQQSGATAFVTTEKDAINLGNQLSKLEPIHIVPVVMQFEDPSDDVTSAVERICGLIARQNQGRVRE